MDPELDRNIGCLIGLAVGDALGTTLEFRPKGSFKPITDMVGGGPFALRPGEWTDDTSMALCLAESLVQRHGFDAVDQMRRYVRWWQKGYRSSRPGDCFDIGNTVSAALRRFERTGEAFAGSTDPEYCRQRLVDAARADPNVLRQRSARSRGARGAIVENDARGIRSSRRVPVLHGADCRRLARRIERGDYVRPLRS
jgi:ADP-ribosylglycohydrolase